MYVAISDRRFVVGTLIPKNCVDALIEALSSDAEKTEEVTFD